MGAPLSAEERTKRAAALIVAETARPIPGPAEIVRLVESREPDAIAEEQVAHRRREPDHPVVTIAISGPPASGKSVIAHVIRHALAREGITAEGPDGLRSLPWRRALDNLLARGLKAVLRREELP